MKTTVTGREMILFVMITFYSFQSCGQTDNKASNMNETSQEDITSTDNSNKNILARGCDPALSLQASKAIPPHIGNPTYIPTTNDVDFIEKLKSQQWSVIYFAPGACRFSAAKQQIPGGNSETKNWTLEEYKVLIYKLQGEDVQIVETPHESESIGLLKVALENARETK